MERHPQLGLDSYDRFSNQDMLPKGGLVTSLHYLCKRRKNGNSILSMKI